MTKLDHHSKSAGFTLTELLIAMTILAVLVLLLASFLSNVSRAWVSGEQQVETFQDGRAILDLISRDLSQAVVSPRLQFIQNPGSLNSLLTSPTTQVNNSEGLFWQSVCSGDSLGNLCEVGYYLTHRTDSKGVEHFELCRFLVPPSDPTQPITAPAPNPSYHIYDSPSPAYYNTSATTIMPPWINLNGKTLDPTRTDFEYYSSVVSDGVVGFWIRCLDSNGDPIPWLSSPLTPNGDTTAAPIIYNSKAYFQSSVPGQPGSFKYTKTGNYAQGDQLPAAVELTIIMVDSRTLERKPTIPPIPSATDPSQIPIAISQMNQDLVTKKIQAARTFSTRVVLRNSAQ